MLANIKKDSTTYQGFRVLVAAGLLLAFLSALDLAWWTFRDDTFYYYITACGVFMIYTGKEALVKDVFNLRGKHEST